MPIPLLLFTVPFGVWTGPQSWGFGWVEPWQAFGFLTAIVGFAIRAHAIGYAAPNTSGGNTRKQVAEDLNMDGCYSLVRHPLYVGNAIIWTAVALLTGSLVAVLVLVPWFVVHYERVILAEEAFLDMRFGERFRWWCQRTPTFVPRWSSWRAPTRRFSWKAVLRREYSAVPAFVISATVVEVSASVHVGLGWVPHPGWTVAALGSVGLYGLLRGLRRAGHLEDKPHRLAEEEDRARHVRTSQA